MRQLLLAAFPASQFALLAPAVFDDATIASDESWGDFHPENFGEEHGRGPVSYQSFVQSLAGQVMQRSGNISEDTKVLLRSIEDAIIEEQAKAAGYHDAQQRQLNRAAAELRQCNVWFNSYNSTQVASAWRAQAEARQNHSICRGQEELAYNDTVEAWESVKQVADSFSLNEEPSLEEPSPSYPVPNGETQPPGINQGSCANFDNWLSSSKATIEQAESSLASAKIAYNSSYEAYKAKHEACDAELAQFDSATCHLGDITCIHCSSYDTCYMTRNATYWAEDGEVRSSEAERKDEHVTMQYLKCLVGELLRPLPNSTAIQGCVDASHDTTHLEINYPGVDAKIDCTSLASTEMPCDDNYETQEYGLWSSHSYSCTGCVNGCIEVTDFGTAATTPGPTTPGPTTPAPFEMVGVCVGDCRSCPPGAELQNWLICYADTTYMNAPTKFGNNELNGLFDWFENNASDVWTAFMMAMTAVSIYTSEQMADDFPCPKISVGPGEQIQTEMMLRQSAVAPNGRINWAALGPPDLTVPDSVWYDSTEWGTDFSGSRRNQAQCWAIQ